VLPLSKAKRGDGGVSSRLAIDHNRFYRGSRRNHDCVQGLVIAGIRKITREHRFHRRPGVPSGRLSWTFIALLPHEIGTETA
jgi:hypothetical protein